MAKSNTILFTYSYNYVDSMPFDQHAGPGRARTPFVIYSLAVPDDDNGVVRVERDVVQLRLLPRDDGLRADRVVLVQVKVEHVHLAVDGHRGEHSAGVGSPGDVANLESKDVNITQRGEQRPIHVPEGIGLAMLKGGKANLAPVVRR